MILWKQKAGLQPLSYKMKAKQQHSFFWQHCHAWRTQFPNAIPARKKLSSHSKYKEKRKDVSDTSLGFNCAHFITVNDNSSRWKELSGSESKLVSKGFRWEIGDPWQTSKCYILSWVFQNSVSQENFKKNMFPGSRII